MQHSFLVVRIRVLGPRLLYFYAFQGKILSGYSMYAGAMAAQLALSRE